MIDKLISEYVNRMTFEDINSFARKQGIILSNKELNIIYKYIKSDWRTIIYGNPIDIFKSLKDNISPLSYSKIENLYMNFKEKYKSYL